MNDEQTRGVLQINLDNYTTEGIDEPIVFHQMSYKKVRRTSVIFVDVYLPLVMKYCDEVGIENVDLIYQYIRVMFETSKNKAIELANKANHKEVLLKYIRKLESLKGNDELMEEYDKYSDTYVAGRELGREEGREEGRGEGREETIIKMAINMLRKGLDPKLVQECTKLSVKKIKSLQMNLW